MLLRTKITGSRKHFCYYYSLISSTSFCHLFSYVKKRMLCSNDKPVIHLLEPIVPPTLCLAQYKYTHTNKNGWPLSTFHCYDKGCSIQNELYGENKKPYIDWRHSTAALRLFHCLSWPIDAVWGEQREEKEKDNRWEDHLCGLPVHHKSAFIYRTKAQAIFLLVS